MNDTQPTMIVVGTSVAAFATVKEFVQKTHATSRHRTIDAFCEMCMGATTTFIVGFDTTWFNRSSVWHEGKLIRHEKTLIGLINDLYTVIRSFMETRFENDKDKLEAFASIDKHDLLNSIVVSDLLVNILVHRVMEGILCVDLCTRCKSGIYVRRDGPNKRVFACRDKDCRVQNFKTRVVTTSADRVLISDEQCRTYIVDYMTHHEIYTRVYVGIGCGNKMTIHNIHRIYTQTPCESLANDEYMVEFAVFERTTLEEALINDN